MLCDGETPNARFSGICGDKTMTTTGITTQDISELVAHDNWPAISITISTARAGADVQQGHIRLKNLLAEAEERLVEGEMRRTLAIDLLETARLLVNDKQFWDQRLDSVAIFISKGFFRAFHLPFHVDDALTVSANFSVLTLMAALNARPVYNILVLDKHNVRLVRCDERSAITVHVDGLVSSIEAFAQPGHDGDSHQQHSIGASAVGRSGRTVIGGGSGDHDEADRARTRRFFAAVDHSIVRHLNDCVEPLVLAGTKDAQAVYRDLTKYAHVLKEGLIPTSKGESNEAFRQAARPLVQVLADAPRHVELERYRAQAGTGLTSQQIEEILVAANAGKVEALLISENVPIWGKFDDVTGTVRINEVAEQTDENLVNRAALSTLRHHGSVFPLAEGELEIAGPAAVFRY
jgi:hypothetical protein